MDKQKRYHKARRVYKSRVEEKQMQSASIETLESNASNPEAMDYKIEAALDNFKYTTEQANIAYTRESLILFIVFDVNTK